MLKKKMYRYKVAEQVTTESKFWTVRKMHYNITVWETEKLKCVGKWEIIIPTNEQNILADGKNCKIQCYTVNNSQIKNGCPSIDLETVLYSAHLRCLGTKILN